MKVLLVANGFPPSAIAGVELYTQALARQLAAAHEVRIVCREADPARPEYSVIRETVEELSVTRIVNNLLDVTDYECLYRNPRIDAIFADELEQFRPDIVHFQHCIGLSAGCIEQAIDSNARVVLTLHDYWYICPTANLLRPDRTPCRGTHHDPNCFDCIQLIPPKLTAVTLYPGYTRWREIIPRPIRIKVLEWLGHARAIFEGAGSPAVRKRAEYMRHILMRSAALVAPSEYVKQRYVEFGIPPEIIHVIPLGMEPEQWMGISRLPQPANQVRLCYVGGLVPQKGCDVAVRAFMQSPGAAALYIYGFEPPGQAFVSHLKKLAAGDSRIHFMGPVPHERLPQVFAEADALLVPTFAEETFSLVVREAFLAGLPVIASNRGVIPDIIQDGTSGRILPAGDIEAWTTCLRNLIDHPEQLEALKPDPTTLQVRSHLDNARDNLALYHKLVRSETAQTRTYALSS